MTNHSCENMSLLQFSFSGYNIDTYKNLTDTFDLLFSPIILDTFLQEKLEGSAGGKGTGGTDLMNFLKPIRDN